jgi:hypothetical protein
MRRDHRRIHILQCGCEFNPRLRSSDPGVRHPYGVLIERYRDVDVGMKRRFAAGCQQQRGYGKIPLISGVSEVVVQQDPQIFAARVEGCLFFRELQQSVLQLEFVYRQVDHRLQR